MIRSRPITGIADAAAARPLTLVVGCGCLISLLTFRLRSSFGVYTDPVSSDQGWGREIFALAMAIQNLAWGVAQPLGGMLADRFGPARVLAGGAVYAFGIALMPASTTPGTMHLSAGLLAGLGMGGALHARTGSYGTVWWLSVALALASALLHTPIAERPASRFGPFGPDWRTE